MGCLADCAELLPNDSYYSEYCGGPLGGQGEATEAASDTTGRSDHQRKRSDDTTGIWNEELAAPIGQVRGVTKVVLFVCTVEKPSTGEARRKSNSIRRMAVVGFKSFLQRKSPRREIPKMFSHCGVAERLWLPSGCACLSLSVILQMQPTSAHKPGRDAQENVPRL